MGLNYHDLNLVALLEPLNRFFDLYTGGKRRPVFFDIDATWPELRELDRHCAGDPRGAADGPAEKAAIPATTTSTRCSTTSRRRSTRTRTGRSSTSTRWARSPRPTGATCPKTAALLDGIPGLFQAFFSILDGGKSIPAHGGPYRGYLRYHLGLVVPERTPRRSGSRTSTYTWQEGESILFDDSWEHEVINDCAEDRVVLIVDIRRPMPFPFDASTGSSSRHAAGLRQADPQEAGLTGAAGLVVEAGDRSAGDSGFRGAGQADRQARCARPRRRARDAPE